MGDDYDQLLLALYQRWRASGKERSFDTFLEEENASWYMDQKHVEESYSKPIVTSTSSTSKDLESAYRLTADRHSRGWPKISRREQIYGLELLTKLVHTATTQRGATELLEHYLGH